MKKTIIAALPTIAVMVTSLFVFAPTAVAYTCGGVETSVDFTMDGAYKGLCEADGASPISAMLLWAISIMSIGVGIAVVIGIILGGIKYAMSDGDTGKAKEGREIITNSIIGLFLFIFLYAGANFLIPGGLFK